MNLRDTKENIEFKYFYVTKFQWVDARDNESNGGHPKEKTLYRGWRNTDTDSYRIITSDKAPIEAVYLEKKASTDGAYGYKSDIQEINLQTILDFPLTEKDLDGLIKWLEAGTEPLIKAMFKETLNDSKIPSIHETAILNIIKSSLPGSQDMQGFNETVGELKSLNPLAFDMIWSLCDHMLNEMYDEQEGSVDADWLKMTPEHSAGVNMHEVLKLVNRYVGSDRRINKDPEDLMRAASCIITELMSIGYEG